MTPILLTPPGCEPVSLDEAKSWLRLEGSDEDDLVARLVTAARLAVEARSGRLLIDQSWRLVLDRWPARGALDMPVAPFTGVTALRVYDASGQAQLLAPAAYGVDTRSEPGRVRLSAPAIPGRPFGGIEIDVTAGYGATGDSVPAPLRQAVLILVARWYEARGDTAFAARSTLPDDVAGLVEPFREGAAVTAFGKGAAAVPIGALRTRVTVEAPVGTDDLAGGLAQVWGAVASAWAAIEPTAAAASLVAGEPEQVVTHQITLRFGAPVDGSSRIVAGSRIFRVQAAFDPDGTRRRLVCLAQETSP